MKNVLTGSLRRTRDRFGALAAGQKLTAVLGSLALLVGGFLVVRWATTPSYAPLYSNLSSADASAVLEELESQGIPYQIAAGGASVMVPREDVYATRIALSGEGIPAGSEGGYSILDEQGMSLSQDAEDTNFKRAMEGELAATIESLDGVQTAVVHLAIPEEEVFADEQDPVTASVLVKTAPGDTLQAEQVQAVVNLVASSIDGLDPDQVTLADATGRVLSAPGGGTGADGGARTQMTSEVEAGYRDKLQAMLDKVVGPGSSAVQVTADLDFDDSTVETRDYTLDADAVPLSSSTTSETYQGAAPETAGGVVGPDGQMDETTTSTTGEAGDYRTETSTVDNAPDLRTETRTSAPGGVRTLHVGVVLDDETTSGVISADEVREMVAATAGIDPARGDTISVSAMPFDTSAQTAAEAELAAAAAADASAARWALYRNIAIGLLVGLLALAVWISRRRGRRHHRPGELLLAEQVHPDTALFDDTQVIDLPPAPSPLALGSTPGARTGDLRRELDHLIEDQPDDVAALLRGWLAERP